VIIARSRCFTLAGDVRKANGKSARVSGDAYVARARGTRSLAGKRRPADVSATGLTHLDERNRPTMVDVGAKAVSHRVATAEARVRFPPNVAEALRKSGHRTKKGPVFDTAIISGVMAAKRTHDLIPFCHPLPLDNCAIEIDDTHNGEIVIRCQASVHHKTGVEMEALTGATVAALTIYDMCKALSHDIEITSVRLVEKTGGKRDFKRKE
jgi:cyclic pyranopterin phosphate synthase